MPVVGLPYQRLWGTVYIEQVSVHSENQTCLSYCPRVDTHGIPHPERHHERRGESKAPTDGIAPPGVLIGAVECEGGVLGQGGNESALEGWQYKEN